MAKPKMPTFSQDSVDARSEWSFGRLLTWHLLRGTRPGGKEDRPGRQWGKKEFADALGISDRTVRYWLANKHLRRPEIETIERVLFGTDNCPQWRLELRFAHERSRGVAAEIPSLPDMPFLGVPPRNAGFIGRAGELDQIDAALLHEKRVVLTQAIGRVAVQGSGGIGKTSVALEYVYRFRDFYAGILWCRAETRSELLSSLASLAVTLLIVNETEVDFAKAANAVLRKISTQRVPWLLVYDNVTRPEEIIDLLPTDGGRVLITTRFPDLANWAEEVPLDVLPMEEAIAFLQRRANRKDEAGAEILAEALDCLPLALDHAAAFCKQTGLRFEQYAQRLEQLINIAPEGVLYPRSVAATFRLALDEAHVKAKSADLLMGLFSLLAPDRIPIELLIQGGMSDDDLMNGLMALTSVALIEHHEHDDGTSSVALHRLVQVAMRHRIDAGGQFLARAEWAVSELLRIFPATSFRETEVWPRCALLLPHVLAVRRHALAELAKSQAFGELLDKAGRYLRARGAYQDAESLFRDALTILSCVLGPTHIGVTSPLNNLANVLWEAGRYADAEPLFRQALSIRETALGEEHLDVAESLNNLGNLLWQTGRYSQAEMCLRRALAIREKSLEPEHPDIAQSLNNLAIVLRYMNRLTEAEPLFIRSIGIAEKTLGSDHSEVGRWLNNFANLLAQDHRYADAEPLYRRAIAIGEINLTRDHPEVAQRLNNLARLLCNTERLDEAQPLAQEAIAIWNKTVGDKHASIGRGRENLARILLKRGYPDEALLEGKAALSIHEKALGNHHLWTRDSACTCAIILEAQGHHRNARSLRKKYKIGIAEEH